MKIKKKLNLKQIRTKNILGYFSENNLGFDDTFELNYARLRIYKVFDEFYDGNSSNKRIKVLINELKKNKKYLNICYKESLKFDKDYRLGEETYGYNLRSIRNNLIYISDRWNCSFRIRWILDLIEKY